ncbi:MAG: ComEC/Rec2 family competence protein [bacterium]
MLAFFRRQSRGMQLLWLMGIFVIILTVVFVSQNLFKEKTRIAEPPPLNSGLWRFISAPVGQGDGQLIINPAGQVAVIDTGKPGSVFKLIRLLEYLGVKKIETLVLTHPHLDHIGGALELIENFEVGKVWDSGYDHPVETYREILKEIDRRDITYYQVKRGEEPELFPGKNVEIINPGRRKYSNPNDASISFVLDMAGTRILLTGDAESEQEKEWVRKNLVGHVEIYSAGHHGSRTSSSHELLSQIKPELIIISAPLPHESPYGHPHGDVIRRFEKMGLEIKHTAKLGYIEVIVDPDDKQGKYSVLNYPFESLLHFYNPQVDSKLLALGEAGKNIKNNLDWQGGPENSYRIEENYIELEAGDDSQLWHRNTTAPQLYYSNNLPENWLIGTEIDFPLEYGREAGIILMEPGTGRWLHWGPTGEGNQMRMLIFDGRNIETATSVGKIYNRSGLALKNGRLIPLVKTEDSERWRQLKAVDNPLNDFKVGIYAKSWADGEGYKTRFRKLSIQSLE